VSLDNTLWFAGIIAEVALVGLLAYRRVWRTMPIFCVYCAWSLLSDVGNYLIQRYSPSSYITTFFVTRSLDFALQFCVLVELAWSVLRPLRASLSRRALVIVGILILAAAGVIWPFAGFHQLGGFDPKYWNILRMEQTTDILRIFFFLVLAGCSQLLSIGWRDRELQIVTGLGLYSLVSLSVALLHIQKVMGQSQQQYHLLDQFVVVGFLVSYAYWIFSFAQQEAERREFTPQMQNFLLAMAGTARTTRIALTETPTTKSRNNRD
jgi:hypothetical protein